VPIGSHSYETRAVSAEVVESKFIPSSAPVSLSTAVRRCFWPFPDRFLNYEHWRIVLRGTSTTAATTSPRGS
jgi:hypothetical protein